MAGKNPLLTNKSSYTLTPLGKSIIEVANNEDSDMAWRAFYTRFLNSAFYMPTIATTNLKNGKASKDSALNLFLSINETDQTRNILLFEKNTRLKQYIKDEAKLDQSTQALIYAMKYTKGFDFLHDLTPKILKEFKVMIDFGKKTCFILNSETLLWLRKVAKTK